MKIYLAGNFNQTHRMINEVNVMVHLSKQGKPYRRLMSYYYLPYTKNMVDALAMYKTMPSEVME